MLIELGLGFGDGYVDLSLNANELTGQSYGGFMTCKTVEADSGVFSLGSKSSIPPTITRRIKRLTISGCSTSNKLAILRFNLH
jgi:hypothetical protein